VQGLVLDGWDVAQAAVQPGGVVPVDPLGDGDPEPVKSGETVALYALCMSASREGWLIQAWVGSFGGRGRRWPNRSGWAA
jgi:hypothetical protein